MTGVLIREKRGRFDSQDMKGDPMRAKAEAECKLPAAKDTAGRQQPPEPEDGMEWILSQSI